MPKAPGTQPRSAAMHRAYQPLLPAASWYLQERWDKADYQGHRRKVMMASPVVNTQGLQPPIHLLVNLKRMQIEGDRQAIRERDDGIHAAKLADIRLSRGQVDNWNNYSVRSLNGEKRRRDLARIWAQNQQLAERLRQQQSHYGRERWERDWQKAELSHSSLTCYPRGLQDHQTGKKKRRQTSLSSRVHSSGYEESLGAPPPRGQCCTSGKGKRRHNATSRAAWDSGAVSSSESEGADETLPCPQRSTWRERTRPAGGPPHSPGDSTAPPGTGAALSSRGLARMAGAALAGDSGSLLAGTSLPRGPVMRNEAAAAKKHVVSTVLRRSRHNPVPWSKGMGHSPGLPARGCLRSPNLSSIVAERRPEAPGRGLERRPHLSPIRSDRSLDLSSAASRQSLEPSPGGSEGGFHLSSTGSLSSSPLSSTVSAGSAAPSPVGQASQSILVTSAQARRLSDSQH